jgi:transcriptional regulator with XRE-family HTH domain
MGVNQRQFAKILDISSGYLSEIEAGKKNPGIEVLNKLFETYSVNISYLFSGEGDLFIDPQKKETYLPGQKNTGILQEADLLEELHWYLKHIPIVRFAVLEFFQSYLFNKKGMIDKEIKKYSEQTELKKGDN